MFFTPSKVLSKTGKTMKRKTMITLAGTLKPNHRTISGTTATIGVE